jgi:hypothetical protein
MLQTREFTLTRGEYVQISLFLLLRSWWWAYVLLLILIILAGVLGVGIIPLVGLIAWWFLLPFFYVLNFVLQAYNSQNEGLFSPRYYQFDTDFVTGQSRDGSVERIRFENVKRVISLFSFYLLFSTALSYHIIPYSVFQTEQDRLSFENQLRAKGLKR